MKILIFASLITLSNLAVLPIASVIAAPQETIIDKNASPDDIAKEFFPPGVVPHRSNLSDDPKIKGLRPIQPAQAVDHPSCSSSSKSISVLVNFGFDSDQLDVESQHILSNVAQAMKKPIIAQCNFLIIGHTDASGRSQYNQALSERRAASVRQFLASQQVEPERLHSLGKGEQEPIASDPYAAENRRVQIAIASEETQ